MESQEQTQRRVTEESFLNSKDQLFSKFQIPESHESKEGSRESRERGQEAVKKIEAPEIGLQCSGCSLDQHGAGAHMA